MNVALILAGGSGTRMGNDLPKQYMNLCEKTVLSRTIAAFYAQQEIGKIAVICDFSHIDRAEALAKEAAREKLAFVIAGGTSRSESARIGLKKLACCCKQDDIVLIHDAARPFVSGRLIGACIAAAKQSGGAIAAVPVTDTIAVCSKGVVECEPDRSMLFAVQTPQAFSYGKIKAAYDCFCGIATDDASVYAAAGHTVKVVPGERSNIKITTTEDLAFAKALLENGGIQS